MKSVFNICAQFSGGTKGANPTTPPGKPRPQPKPKLKQNLKINYMKKDNNGKNAEKLPPKDNSKKTGINTEIKKDGLQPGHKQKNGKQGTG